MQRMNAILPTALLLAASALIWELVVRVQQVPLYLVPPPSAVAERWLRDPSFFILEGGVSLAEALGGLAVGGGAAFAAGELGLAAWLLAVGGISDILDGRVARARGIASRYGAFLDSTLDRFAETGTFIGVAWYLTGAPWLTAAALLAVSGSLLVSYTRARGEALGAPFSGGLMQRAERVVLLILGALLDAPVTGRTGWAPGTLLAGTVVLIAFGTLATAIYRAVVIARRLAKAEAGSGGTDV
jgi:CDP-diacylglycerol--glycerol-3-phosphate 3-phosphatidyltransferase